MMATFTAASIQSAFENIGDNLGVSIQRASYLTSLQIAILGTAPLFWRPLSNRFGRRPVFLFSLICSLVGNIGCAESKSYGTLGLCRAIVAWFISPAAAIGTAVVQETYFKKDRARYMGIWTLMVTLGVPVSPFIFGFVALRVGYNWIFWTLAIVRTSRYGVGAIKSLLISTFCRPTVFNSSYTFSLVLRHATSVRASSTTHLLSRRDSSNSPESIRPHSRLWNLSSHFVILHTFASSSQLWPTP